VGPLIRVIVSDWPGACHLDYACSGEPFGPCEVERRVLIGQCFMP
jgi:hypothetical protein